MAAWSIEPQGDRCLVIVLGDRVDVKLNRRAQAIAEALSHARPPGVLDVVPTFATVAVHYRPQDVEPHAALAPWQVLEAQVTRVVEASTGWAGTAGRVVEIPVCYDAEFGPDTAEVAAHCGVEAGEVAPLHAATEHFAYMIGFSPGQPYLGGLDARLDIPRRSTPRLRVPQGSVAIARGMTAVYSLETPGGWNLIGRTPLQLFMPHADPPCLLRAGDRVRFRPVTRAQYERLLVRQS